VSTMTEVVSKERDTPRYDNFRGDLGISPGACPASHRNEDAMGDRPSDPGVMATSCEWLGNYADHIETGVFDCQCD
jgi:hypothetical protein